MKRAAFSLALAVMLPAAAAGQEDLVERLNAVLPEDVAKQVIEQIQAAQARELPAQALANLALEGVAKGRGAEDVLAAVEILVEDMGRAQEALQGAGHEPGAGDIEAATAALRMGVDGEAVSALAKAESSGRSMAVPLLVMGGLVERGLPSDEALAAVRDRLTAAADDADLLGEFPEVAQGLARGMRPEQVGPALAGGFAGFTIPVGGVAVPVGPPDGLPGRRPGRGGGI